MRIGVFVVMAGRNAGGLETYEHALVRNLAQLDQDNEYRVFCFTKGAADSFDVNQANIKYEILGNLFRPFTMSVSLPILLKARGTDLMHATCVPPPVSPVNYVFTLHCSSVFMRPELFPPLIRWRLLALVRQGMHHARHILCVSQDVLDRAADYYKISRDRMSVAYNGVGEHFKPVATGERDNILARLGIVGPYFLFAGRFEPRKNVIRLIEAFDIFRREVDGSVKLALAGSKTWSGGEVDETIKRLQLGSHVIETGHVKNEDLPALYSGALAFVFPSLWEGFGLPVVEAMACGTPVLTSNLSALPEITGGAAILVDPLSVTDIASGMERIARDAALRTRLQLAGLERAKDFSWRRTAKQALAAYAAAR